MDVNQLLNQGLAYHQAGQLPAAEACYRQVLGASPNSADALNLYGVLLHQMGRHADALGLLQRAVAINPSQAQYYNHLGLVLHALNRHQEAIGAYERSLMLDSSSADTYNNLGFVLQEQGNLDAALQQFNQALALRPQFAPAHYNMGNTFKLQGKLQDAVLSYQRAVACKPDYAEAYNNLGNTLLMLGEIQAAMQALQQALHYNPRLVQAYCNLGNALHLLDKHEEAIAYYQQALVFDPHDSEIYNNMGFSLQCLGQYDAAIRYYEQALQLNPRSAGAYYNMGTAYQFSQRLQEARYAYQQAVSIMPGHAEAQNNLGTVYKALGEYETALACYGHAIGLRQDYVEAHLNRAFVWLLQGRFDMGWSEYEWRLEKEKYAKRRPPGVPAWQGEDLHGKRILVLDEQGYGDTFQCLRFLPMLKARGATVILEYQPGLGSLVSSYPGVDEAHESLAPTAHLPVQADYHVFLMSLPMLLSVTLENLPPPQPPLTVADDVSQHWQSFLSAYKGFKIGISWSGNPENSFNPTRMCPLQYWEPLARVLGVTVFCLSKLPLSPEEQTMLDAWGWQHLGGQLTDFADTAAVIQQLDLVISVDTAVAHLTGALQKPVWVLLPLSPDWRWLLDREDSPWYPTARLFRQPKLGDWGAVMEQVQAALSLLVLAPVEVSVTDGAE